MLELLNFNRGTIASLLDRFRYVLIAALFGLALTAPLLLPSKAGAATLTSRSVTIATSEPSQTGVTYTFGFTLPSATAVEGVVLEFCTTALGTCTLPTGMDIDRGTTSLTSTSFSGAAFTEYGGADSGACTTADGGSGVSTQYCITGNNTSQSGAHTIVLASVTNPSLSGNFTSVYVRINLYSAINFATLAHNGTVAAAIVRQITVNGRVAERLDFCVGAVTDADAGAPDSAEDAAITGLTDNGICTGSFPTTTTIDIGVIDDTAIYFSPVDTTPTNGALDNYGLAAVKTNASNGVAVTFFAEDIGSVSGGDTHHLKAFRVSPTDCASDQTTGAGLVDQCFRTAVDTGTGAPAPTDFTALSGATRERFGMKVACFYQNATFSTTAALTADGDFDDSAVATAADCENTTDNANYAWNETTTAETLASSTGVVDDELIKFAFGATASSTTPTGSYTVVSTYIATPTF